tara:strand:+ start:4351 stop:5145 length:795 start_codon:yes stop_codon:yes gene_type:complete
MKLLINFLPTGLGDRLQYNIKKIPYLKSKFKQLDIYASWKINNQCLANFEDLFKNVYNINFVDELFSEEDLLKNEEEICSKLNIKPIDLTHKALPKENTHKVLQIKDEILNEILSLQKKYQIDKSVIGIHLRVPENFDFKNPEKILDKDPSYANWKAKHLMDNLSVLEKNYDFLKNKRVLVFSDSKELIEEMLLKYDNFFTIDECEKLPIDNKKGISHVRRSKESVIAGLKAAGLLSLCNYNNKIKLRLTSNFSKIPTWIKIGN